MPEYIFYTKHLTLNLFTPHNIEHKILLQSPVSA